MIELLLGMPLNFIFYHEKFTNSYVDDDQFVYEIISAKKSILRHYISNDTICFSLTVKMCSFNI